MSARTGPVAAWHTIAGTRDPAGLDALLHEDCVFRSPAVHTPQVGKAISSAYLAAALVVLGPTLRYVGEWVSESSAVLEFEATVGGLDVHGIDLLRWDDGGLLTSFTVMVRPLKGLQALVEAMGAELTRGR